MAEDPILRWIVEARNYIEKQGDLLTASTMRVSITDSYIVGIPYEAAVPPNLRSQEIAHFLATSTFRPKNFLPNSTLRVERRWVDSKLPDHEVLTAISHALRMYVEVLADAHGKLIPEAYEGKESSDMQRLQESPEARFADIALDTNDFVKLTRRPIRTDAKLKSLAVERYGDHDLSEEAFESLESFARAIMARAREIIAIDRWHALYVWFFHAGAPVRMITHMPNDRREKFLFWHDMAEEAARLDADGIVTVAEAWQSTYPIASKRKVGFPADDPDRKETLVVTAESVSGYYLSIFTEFSRAKSGQILFGNTFEDRQFRAGGFMEPIRAVWRKKHQV